MNDAPLAPIGYKQIDHLFSDWQRPRWQLFVWANLLALIPLAVGIGLLWLPYQYYVFIGLPWSIGGSFEWGTAVTLFIALLIIIASMLIHELLHALALKLLGHRPILGVQRGFLLAGIRPGDFLPRTHYFLITVVPLVFMSLGGGVLLLLLPHTLGKLLLIALLLNFPASLGDLLVAQRVRGYPSETLFASKNTFIYAYLPVSHVYVA